MKSSKPQKLKINYIPNEKSSTKEEDAKALSELLGIILQDKIWDKLNTKQQNNNE